MKYWKKVVRPLKVGSETGAIIQRVAVFGGSSIRGRGYY